jgi:hypothetical protein
MASGLNGIDYLEVSTDQKTLDVYFLKTDGLGALRKGNFAIEGGERIREVVMATEPSIHDNCATLELDKYGDFSTYVLRLQTAANNVEPPVGFAPVLSAIEFSFKVSCPSDFDCRKQTLCQTFMPPSPNIDYLAKDYASFRQVLLDRLSLLMPDWRERSPADLQVALVELLAYVGDRLSYEQDAVATEAYLGTARRRVSVRRHARLVDYSMHDGCNARGWVAVTAAATPGSQGEVLPGPAPGRHGMLLLTGSAKQGLLVAVKDVQGELARGATPFETMHDLRLYAEHNELHFHTWGDARCCLPRGSTGATLEGHHPHLKVGDVLILQEVRGPKTGEPEDASPARRHAVRLSHVVSTKAGTPLIDPVGDSGPVEITEIQWDAADALPFPLCISSEYVNDKGTRETVSDVSVAFGNVVLADHGRTVDPAALPPVPQADPDLFWSAPSPDRCKPAGPEPVLPRYRPRLEKGPVTQAARYGTEMLFELTFAAPPAAPDLVAAFAANGVALRAGALSIQGGDGEWSVSDGNVAFRLLAADGRLRVERPAGPARDTMRWTASHVVPSVLLAEASGATDLWIPRRDLLGSLDIDKHFVLEVEEGGEATLRFGDDRCGRRPDSGTEFSATYRVGNGRAGNIGAETIRRVVNEALPKDLVIGLRNPMPAVGGLEPESIEDVRKNAPEAFRIQERAVTAEDYAAMAERHPGVQKAAATLRWTGSWYTVFVTIDRKGGLPVDAAFETEIRQHLEKYRMAGHDLEVDGPRYVSLEIGLEVCVAADHFQSDVKAALLELFSNRALPGGRCGLFHPDNFTFGQPVFLSPLYAAAQAVPGVVWVRVKTFERQGTPSRLALGAGKLVLGRLEIARLDNDPNYPERGVLHLILKGGK